MRKTRCGCVYTVLTLISIQLVADIAEMNSLIGLAKRDTVKQVLQGEITMMEQRQASLKKQIEEASKPTSNSNYDHLKSVTNFMWDQTKDYVKIYIEFGDQPVDASEIKLDVTSKRSFVLVFGNRKFVQSKLHADIDKAESHFKTTKSKIVVYLKKVNERHWTSLQEKKDSYKQAVEEDKDEMANDPQAGLMKLMKKMYDEGDDDMKRTIAKSWYEAQHKKDGDPMSAFSDD